MLPKISGSVSLFKALWVAFWNGKNLYKSLKNQHILEDVLASILEWGVQGSNPQTPPLLTWFSLFLVRFSANFAKKIQELAEDKAENPRTCRGQSREQNPYERLPENTNLKALFFKSPSLTATLQTPKTLGGGTPPWGASIISLKFLRTS